MLIDKAKLFKAVSDPNRLRILKMLQMKDLCVCEITEVLQLAPSTVSKHLSILKESGYILEEKDGKWVNYSINRKPSDPALASLIGMMHIWLEDIDLIKKDRATINKVDRALLCK
ncbi:metalloregulator ArsR/SmtB family transcription factor [bacterium]|nr:metalloregulator ArsR/SmtB family transcription factor [bacterium]